MISNTSEGSLWKKLGLLLDWLRVMMVLAGVLQYGLDLYVSVNFTAFLEAFFTISITTELTVYEELKLKLSKLKSEAAQDNQDK